MRSRFIAFFGGCFLVACGGGPAPAPATPPPPSPIAATPPPGPVDLSAVGVPDGLLIVGRVSNPDGVVKAVGSWAHLPLPGGRELVRSITEDAVAEIVDLSQPIDGALVLTGMGMRAKPLAAFSVAVKSLDEAKMKLGVNHKITAGANGSFRVDGIGEKKKPQSTGRGRGRKNAEPADDDDDDDAGSCVLAPAPTGARLVCGDPGALESLVPYLTRTITREKWSSDVHLEVHPEPVREPLNQIRSSVPLLLRGVMGNTSSPAFRELADAGIGEVVDFVNDTQKIAIDAKIADAGLDATTRIEFSKSTSLIAKMATSRPEKADVPPPSFFHLPQETDVAFFARGSDPQLFDRPKKLLANVILEGTQMVGFPESERKTVRDLVADRLFSLFTNGPVLYAKGYDAAALEKAIAARQKVKPDDLAATDAAEVTLGEQIIGWHLVQVSEPVDKVGSILKDVSGLWNRPAIAKWIKDSGASAKSLPKVRIAPSPAGVTLPKDTVHLEVTIPRDEMFDAPAPPPPPPGAKGQAPPKPLKPVARKPIVVHLLAVSDGKNGTFLGFGLDAKLVAQKAAASLATAPEAGTLGKAAGYEALQKEKMNGAGILTLRGLLVFTAMARSSRSPYQALTGLPNKGATPVLLSFKSDSPSDGAKGGSATSTLRVPRAAIEDVVNLVMH
jgi:hypothetical protein